MSAKNKQSVSHVDGRLLEVLIECAIKDDSKTARQTINKIVKHKLTKRISNFAKAFNK